MRNFYIVLAGLITAAAVLGWSGREEAKEPETPKVVAPAPEVEVVQHKLTVSAMSKEDTSLRAAIDAVTNDSRVKAGVKPVVPADFKLLGPDVSPSLDVTSNTIKMPDYKAVLDLLLENAQLASRSVAIADLSRATILASKDSAWLLSEMKVLSGSDGEKLALTNGNLGRLAWKCLEETREHCVIGFAPVETAIKNACDVAKTTFVSFDGKPVDTVSLFGADACKVEAVYGDLAKALAAKTDSKGKVEVNGASYQFERSKLENGIEIVSVLELVPEVSETPKAEVRPTGFMGYSYPTLGIAVGAGIVMVLLGIFCTRRREKKPLPETENNGAKEELGESEKKIKALKSENDSLKSEVENLKKKESELEDKVKQINGELEASKNELEHEQISRMSLAQENQRLEDSIVADGKDRTLVDSPANIAALQEPLEKVLEETAKEDKKEEKIEEEKSASKVEESSKSEPEAAKENVPEIDKETKSAKQPSRPGLPKLGTLKVGTVSTTPKTEPKLEASKTVKATKASETKASDAKAADAKVADAKAADAKAEGKSTEAKDAKNGRGDKNTQEITDPNRITAQIDASINPVSSKENSQAFFESFSDEGWDEISESFDELFNNGSVFNEAKAGKASRSRKSSDVKEERSGQRDISLGMSGFLEAVKKPEEQGRKAVSTVILKKANATGEVPPLEPQADVKGPGVISMPRTITDSGRPRLPTIKSAGPGLHTKTLLGTGTGLNDKPRTTITGINAISKATIEDVPDMPKSLQLITPWRDETEKKRDNGMDENSLLDALKRRAKDVSEIDSTSADGSLEYNRGLSRSGVFSVTGSRVDIDPLSDSEYFKALYTEFSELQKKCGDTTELTLEQFVSKLARKKEAILQSRNWKNVRFVVYEKDGKASVMAKPQK